MGCDAPLGFFVHLIVTSPVPPSNQTFRHLSYWDGSLEELFQALINGFRIRTLLAGRYINLQQRGNGQQAHTSAGAGYDNFFLFLLS